MGPAIATHATSATNQYLPQLYLPCTRFQYLVLRTLCLVHSTIPRPTSLPPRNLETFSPGQVSISLAYWCVIPTHSAQAHNIPTSPKSKVYLELTITSKSNSLHGISQCHGSLVMQYFCSHTQEHQTADGEVKQATMS